MKSAVYILCGIPFSGKSTLARLLAQRCGWTHVDVDAIVRSLIAPGEQFITDHQWDQAFSRSYEIVADSLARRQSAIHDATNYARTVRDRLRAIARQYDASAHVIYVNIPFDVANQRRHANQAQSQRHQVSDADFQEVVNNLEPPTVDESVLVFDGTLDIETWITRYICEPNDS